MVTRVWMEEAEWTVYKWILNESLETRNHSVFVLIEFVIDMDFTR